MKIAPITTREAADPDLACPACPPSWRVPPRRPERSRRARPTNAWHWRSAERTAGVPDRSEGCTRSTAAPTWVAAGCHKAESRWSRSRPVCRQGRSSSGSTSLADVGPRRRFIRSLPARIMALTSHETQSKCNVTHFWDLNGAFAEQKSGSRNLAGMRPGADSWRARCAVRRGCRNLGVRAIQQFDLATVHHCTRTGSGSAVDAAASPPLPPKPSRRPAPHPT